MCGASCRGCLGRSEGRGGGVKVDVWVEDVRVPEGEMGMVVTVPE